MARNSGRLPGVLSAFVVCFLFLFAPLHAKAGSIVSLNDEIFEHQTQATTGSTTGSWFILFKAEGCEHCKAVMPEFQKLAEDEELDEAGVVLATLDVPSNHRTSNRFDIRGYPTLLFLHKGYTYSFKGKKRQYEILKDFALGGFKETEGKPTPEPQTPMEEAIAVAKAIAAELSNAATGKSGAAGMGLVLMVVTTLCLPVLFCYMLLKAGGDPPVQNVKKNGMKEKKKMK